jgi:hypothetical protein
VIALIRRQRGVCDSTWVTELSLAGGSGQNVGSSDGGVLELPGAEIASEEPASCVPSDGVSSVTARHSMGPRLSIPFQTASQYSLFPLIGTAPLWTVWNAEVPHPDDPIYKTLVALITIIQSPLAGLLAPGISKPHLER